MTPKIYIDSDVILDLLLERQPFADQAEALFIFITEKRIPAFSTAVAFSNLFYILHAINKKKNAKKAVQSVHAFMTILPIPNKTFKKTYHSIIPDFEDAIQYEACLEHDISFIIDI